MNGPPTVRPSGFWHRFDRQLSHPDGIAGRALGCLMARVNRTPYRVAIQSLAPASADQVLEIGYGPGEGVAALAPLLPAGHISGLDIAPAMFRQASRRNARAIAEGRIDLRVGDARRLPWPDSRFNRVLAVNVAYFFDPDGVIMSEIHRVLMPRGRVVLYVTDRSSLERWPFAGPETHVTYDGHGLKGLLLGGGFREQNVGVQEHRLPFGMRGLIGVASTS